MVCNIFIQVMLHIGIEATKRNLVHIISFSMRHLYVLYNFFLESRLFIMELQWPEFLITRTL